MDYWYCFKDDIIKVVQPIIAGVVVLYVTQRIQRGKERNKLRNVLHLLRNEVKFHALTFEQYKNATFFGEFAVIVGTEEWKNTRNILIDLDQSYFSDILMHYTKLETMLPQLFNEGKPITENHAMFINTLYDSSTLALDAIEKAFLKLN